MIKLSSVSILTLDHRGGEVIRLHGVFDPDVALEMLFVAGGRTYLAYSGRAGQGSRLQPSFSYVSAVSPAFASDLNLPATATLQVRLADAPDQVATLAQSLSVVRPTYASLVYALRALHPPLDATGPRSLVDEQAAQPMLPGALLQPLLDALGEAYTGFGGTRSTYALAAAAKGNAVLNLHSTHLLGASSRLLIGSQVYSIGGVTPAGVSGLRPYGQAAAGLVAAVSSGDEVIDVTPKANQLGRLHESYFLDSAEGVDLSTCGRNLGLTRDPSIRSDATYAAACQTIAYGPRGTMQGIRHALDALVGPGNYTLRQDTLNFPFMVFISLPQALTLAQKSTGRTYLSGPRPKTPQGAQNFLLPAPVEGVERIVRQAVDSTLGLDAARPTIPWVYSGGAEQTDVRVVSSGPGAGGFVLTSTATLYAAELAPEAFRRLELSLLMRPVQGPGTVPGSTGLAWGVAHGGKLALARIDTANNGALSLQVCDRGGQALAVPALSVQADAFVEVSWRRIQPDAWVLQAGSQSLVVHDAILPSSSDSWGQLLRFGAAATNVADILFGSLRLFVDQGQNYAEASGQASVAAQTLTFDRAYPELQVGQQVVLAGSAAQIRSPGQNLGPSGSNDGAYLVDAVSASAATLIRFRRQDAVLGSQAAASNQMDLPDAALRYPQDLGRQVVIAGQSGNAGTYYISALIDALGQVCRLPYARRCASCLLVSANGSTPIFVSEASTPVVVQPAFVTESGLAYRIAVGFALVPSGANVQLRLYQPLPDASLPYDITYDDHLGSTLIDEQEPVVVQTGDDPVRFSTYPIYFEDSLSFVGNYLDQLTVAGVRAVVDVV